MSNVLSHGDRSPNIGSGAQRQRINIFSVKMIRLLAPCPGPQEIAKYPVYTPGDRTTMMLSGAQVI
ncbi:MAG: hypothetical protein AB4352_22215 [Hormoscilla sp.]